MGFIYKISNNDNEKVYIGQTKKSIKARWSAHKHAIKGGKGCPLLARAFNAHGEDKFSIEIVEECADDQLNEREKYYISHFNSLAPNGYNADAGGKSGGTFKGHKHKPETIARWKEKVKDLYASKEHREKLSNIAKEYYKNPENRAKHAAKMKEVSHNSVHSHKFKNRIITEETKQKIRESVNKYYENSIEKDEMLWSENNKQKHSKIMTKVNGRRVGKYNDNGDLIETFNSVKEAAYKNNITQVTLWRYLKINIKGNSGFWWKYIDEGASSQKRVQNRNTDYQKHKEIMTKLNGRKVHQYTKEGIFIASFNSVIEASEKTNIKSANIYQIVRNKRKTAGGYIWKYADAESKEAAPTEK